MVQIGKREMELPVIQGGMGVGVSLGGLAGAVAACGGMGCISAAQPGYRETDFHQAPQQANLRALEQEIVKAKSIAAGRGLVAVNVMVALGQYADLVRCSAMAGADAIISGAGLPLDLPALVGDSTIALAPIVSSGRAAKLICKTWDRKYGVAPDFVVIEGSLAGGHLGFKPQELREGTTQSLEEILAQVLLELAPYSQQYGRAIPVFVAGGICSAQELAHFQALGAAGVQIATRFIATHECDASDAYKNAIIAAGDEDACIIQSPVGMPGRAMLTPLVQRMNQGQRHAPTRCSACIKSCNPATTPYCITDALIQAVKGDWENGLFFCGANVGRVNTLSTVAQVMAELTVSQS